MKIASKIAIVLTLVLLAMSGQASAQNVTYYILQSPNLADAQTACQSYGLTMVSTIHAPNTYLVAASSSYTLSEIQALSQGDPNVKKIDLNHTFTVPETTQLAIVSAPSVPLTTYLTNPTLVRLFGPNVWASYVQQPAFYSTNAYEVTPQLQPLSQLVPASASGTAQFGWGSANQFGWSYTFPAWSPGNPLVVAVIDSGIDQLNPVLSPYVIPGYDFTTNTAGFASDVAALNQSTAAILEQSTAAILEQYQVAVLNQSTAAILEQSTAAILESTSVPGYFGHGTMTAGLIHLVAPNSQLMPLRAFAADGTGSEANIIQAIYYAANNGATVINMSFELPQISDAMMKAINYASRRGVICIASAGNDAGTTLVYPAGFGNVVSVASVNASGQQSTFSNYGPDLVQIGAPGEGLITTYAGSNYAVVSGTSFSAALVSGGVSALIQESNSNITSELEVGDIQRALSHAIPCGTNGSLGAGCVDFNQAANFIKGMNMPKATATSIQ